MKTFLLIIIALALIGFGLWLFAPGYLPWAGEAGSEAVACTLDAKMCPDGSYVGRIPPSCEFAACPGQ
jgi:hypothetical protein